MSRLQWKVCGMRDGANIRLVAALSPDYMGFIFYRRSRRYVGDAFTLEEEFPASIRRVGVFVNELTGEIVRLANKHGLHFIQLHGDETIEQCDAIRSKGYGVIKAFGMSSKFNFEKLRSYANVIDYFLFDTKGNNYGGSGMTFDWRILRRYDLQKPFFLSGGITADNITGIDILEGLNLHAIDVNSGVESEAGLKDVSLIKELKMGMKNIKLFR